MPPTPPPAATAPGVGIRGKNDIKLSSPAAGDSDKALVARRSSGKLSKAFNKAMLGNVVVRAFFKTRPRRPRTPAEVVSRTTLVLDALNSFEDNDGGKRFPKMGEVDTLIREMKSILYGSSDSEPAAEACAQLTQEFFKGNTLRLIVHCLPKLNLEARKDATQVVANLQRQPVNSRLIASDYLEANLDIVDHLVSGYEDSGLALHYGAMLRECIRHQVVASHILKSGQVRNFFGYMQLPEFDVAADAATTFKELLTRHKSTVAEFLSGNNNWESSKPIQLDAFHVFKLFVANTNRPPGITSVLANNKEKLLRLFAGLRMDKDDELFESDKTQIMKEISGLELPRQAGDVYKLPKTPMCSGELSKVSPLPTPTAYSHE
ncbi:unnamed protein product [Cuscuta campestris]|uniref:MO25-like protein n=1 Tax=Cuscuta campestris TaxID=132261 RepID=A0A484L1P3_9ASTE|nr:unnamed protein product [Cuscuta campestris]